MQLIKNNPTLFSDTPSRTSVLSHDIDVADYSPIKQHAYRVNPTKRALLQQEVIYLLENGLAVPSSSAWSSPCLLVPKPDKALRFCTDFRKVNAITKPDSYPLPRMEDCVDRFADDTTVVGLISKNDESAYREEVQRLTAWCGANNLSLNVDKTKEMVVDFRRAQGDHSPLFIDGSSVEIVKSTKFLGVHLADNLTWSVNTSSITKKAQQRLYFLRRLRKAHLPPPILTMFYRGTIESILSSCITAWFGNCTVADRKTLQRIVRTAEKIIGVSLPSIMHIYTTRCIRKANSIVDDPTHPSHTLFTLLPSGKRFRSIRATTSRLCNSFFPQAIRLLNTQN
ncbi:hypothetical protein Q8A73_000102 [Channa argus]|nr:hypothetical protein Q8A73_000102 [Channa argus]